MDAFGLAPRVPIWAQRRKDEIREAKRHCLTFAQECHEALGGPDVVPVIVQFVMRSCVGARAAGTFFYSLRECAERGGQRFSVADVDEAMQRCLERFGLKRGMAAPAEASAEAAGEKDGGDSDLSGEEAVDGEEGQASAEILADLGVELDAAELAADAAYPAWAWDDARELRPGCLGFNARATRAMRRAKVGGGATLETGAFRPEGYEENGAGGCSSCEGDAGSCPPLQMHQESVAFLLHPRSPVERLLVDHPVGSGKTREMIRVLDNYFYDPRPKVPIFPKSAVCRNFYMELLRWPSRYRDYFSCVRPADACAASQEPDWRACRHAAWDVNRLPEALLRQLCYSIREVLEMPGMSFRGLMRRSFRVAFKARHPGEPMPLAPLRAISYASAGGSFSRILRDWPASAVMKIGYEPGCGVVYTNKVVLLDEAHNLIREQTQYAEQLRRLRGLLLSARGHVLAGFTGTPILSDAADGRKLLDHLRGGASGHACDEGFVSSFSSRPRHLFPECIPHGVPDGILTESTLRQLVVRVQLCGEALAAYDLKRQHGTPARRLRAYCNVCSYATSFHDGRGGCKARILASPEASCPKLLAVARAVAATKEKALVLVSRSSGYTAQLALLQKIAESSVPPFKVATMEQHAEFNHVSNVRGEIYRVLVADAAQCSEGVSFLSVRRAHLVDVPATQSQFVQQCGRSIRMCGHRGLPEEEQTVVTQLYVATFPEWMKSPLGCWSFRAQRRQRGCGAEAEARAPQLLKRLQRAGIRTIEELISRAKAAMPPPAPATAPQRVEPESQAAAPPARVATSEAVDNFLRREGLWEGPSSERPIDTLRAVQALLQQATSPELQDATLRPSTADEDALQTLKDQIEELAPAAEALRRVAVDRELFYATAASGDEPLRKRLRLRGKRSVPCWYMHGVPG
eukprot:TRINITY_DN17825_c0_g6_i1.p1 TRINITY_DN17825_c0_g6~~TRINITY_DN17825_c0_g6_i1.p1  ORF type:complete len:918 (-),score=203.12 TRINITY_DN17825_c0_g6_i1:13-2766(-)